MLTYAINRYEIQVVSCFCDRKVRFEVYVGVVSFDWIGLTSVIATKSLVLSLTVGNIQVVKPIKHKALLMEHP